MSSRSVLEDEAHKFYKELGRASFEDYASTMEMFLEKDCRVREKILHILRDWMLEAAQAGEDFCEVEYTDFSSGYEEAVLIVEEWLQSYGYLFEFEEGRKETGQRVVTLVIYLGE